MRAKGGLQNAPPRVVNRRRFLKALGLGVTGVGTGSLFRPSIAQTQGDSPNRVLFWLTDHGTVPENWNMNLGFSGDATQIASLSGLEPSSWSPILQPLAPYADKLNILEGIGRAAELDYERRGGEGDRHTFGQTMVMTCVDSIHDGDIMGGSASIDQVIGEYSTAPGRWAARVYGRNHFKGYSFTDAGRPTPLVGDPSSGFDDIMGLYVPAEGTSNEPESEAVPEVTREQRIRIARASVLDFAADEFDYVTPRMGRDERLKLEEHQTLIRDLELTLGGGSGSGGGGTGGGGGGATAACDPNGYDSEGSQLDQFGRIAALAFSCDMTRSIFIIGGLDRGEFDIPEGRDFHQDIAHKADSDEVAARVMTDFNTAYARHFAQLIGHMDSISDGNGTLLDNTITTWLTELATGPHELDDVPYVIAGGGAGALKTGQYVRYERANRLDGGWDPYRIGPSNGNLYVTLMQSMGMPDDTFGVTEVQGMEIRGPLQELLA
jgi:hypothetical protein